MMRQLTKEETQELYQFTKTHRIRYYDLQTEVVDHLARGASQIVAYLKM